MKTQIKTGDTVKVIAGDNKGKTAKVVRVSKVDNKVVLEGIGQRTRHMRPTQYQKGGKKEIQTGLHISNVKLVESATYEKSKKATSKSVSGSKTAANGKKTSVSGKEKK